MEHCPRCCGLVLIESVVDWDTLVKELQYYCVNCGWRMDPHSQYMMLQTRHVNTSA